MKKYLFAASCILLLATACKKEPDYHDPLAGGKEKDEISVKTLEITESAASFAWSLNKWSNPEADFAASYEFAVYSDATCETPVLGWKDVTLSRQLSSSYKDLLLDKTSFTFTGLESNTDYWFQVKNKATLSESKKIKFHTPASKNVAISSTEAAVGDIILYEDFSECLYGGDHINIAPGYKVDVPDGGTPTFFKAEGMNPNGVSIVNPTTDAPLFVFGQRIMNWAQNEADKVHSQAGYIKIGKSSGTRGQLITPVLSSLKQGKLAKVEVSFLGCPYSSGCQTPTTYHEIYVDVRVCEGGTFVEDGNVLLTPEYSEPQKITMTDATAWKEYKVTLEGVKPTSRISIGGGLGELSHANGYARFFVDNVQVKVLEYEDEPLPEAELKVDKVFWSNAVLSWVNPVDVIITGYELYINNTKKADITADQTSYNLTGLTKGTTYTAKLVGATANGDQNFNEVEFTTGNISQVRKNVGPTSLSVAFDNCSGEISGEQTGCFHVQLFAANDATSTPVYSTYVLDAQNLSHGTPFLTSLAAGGAKPIAPTAVAFGNLTANTHYWFRVKCVDSYTYNSYKQNTKTASSKTITSAKGSSEYSELVEVYTEPAHAAGTNEVFYMGFDKVTILADFVNLAAGTYPACYAEGTAHTAMTASQVATWDKGWCFYPLRTQLTSSQFANHNAWHEGGLKPDPNHVVNTTSSSAVTSQPKWANGATIYKFKEDQMAVFNLKDWYISNNVWPNQGCLALGVAYNPNDGGLGTDGSKLGFIATPALEANLPGDGSPVACTLTFKALALQGAAINMNVGVWDASESTSEPSWGQSTVFNLKNSTGTTTASTDFTITDAHKWYEYSVDVNLGKGDRIGFATDKNGTAVIDDIQIVKK